MRKLVFLLLLMVMSVWSLAAENTFIREARDIEWNAQHVRTADDCEIVFWDINPGLESDIWAQKLDSDGQVMWAEPMLIVGKPGGQSLLSVVRTSDNNFIIMWKENYQYHDGDIWMQKIDPNGQFLWTEEGVFIADWVRMSQASLLANDEGGAYVFFAQNYIAMGQYLDQGGSKLWQPEGVSLYELQTYNNNIVNSVSDGSGGAIVNCDTSTGNKLLHVSSTGSLIGTNPMIEPASFPQLNYNIASGSNGEFILYSRNYQTVNPFYMQKMNANGDLLFPNAIDASFTATSIYPPTIQVVAASDGGAYVLMCFKSSQSDSSIKIQRLDATFTPLWATGGTDVCNVGGGISQQSAYLNVNANGDAWVTWILDRHGGYNGYANFELRIQHFNADGEALWAVGGNRLNQTNFEPTVAVVLPYADHAMFVWQDFQDTLQVLHRQVISSDGELSLAFGGEPFVNTIAGRAFYSQTVAMNDRYFCTWRDNRNGKYRDYYQITDTELNPLLEPNGRVLNFVVGTRLSKIMALPDNSVVIVYCLFDQGSNYVYLQKIDANGNTVYPEKGILVSASHLVSRELSIDYYAGDIYIGWLEKNATMEYVKAQRLSNGHRMWGDAGTTLSRYPYAVGYTSFLKVCGRFFVWDYVTIGTDQSKVMTMLLNSDGSPAPGWDATGLSLLGEDYTQSLQIFDCGLVGDDLVALIQYTYNNVIYHVAQKINVTGQRLWQDWGRDFSPPVTHAYEAQVLSCLIDDEITILLRSEYYFYCKKFSADGDLLYPDIGIAIEGYHISSDEIQLIKYDNGSIAVYWLGYSHYEIVSLRNLSVLHITPQGHAVENAPVVLYKYVCRPIYPSAANIGNSSIVTWTNTFTDIQPYDGNAYTTSILACRIDSSPVGIEDEINIASPMPRLRQNYPNPFNPVTTIAFDLSTAQPASLRVYNIKGQLVKTLLHDSSLSAGTHSLEWDGRDEQGNTAAGGIYFYRLTTPDKTITKKMVMLK